MGIKICGLFLHYAGRGINLQHHRQCNEGSRRALGPGFQELIYQRALAVEFRNRRITFAREQDMIVYYEGEEIGIRRVDFFVEGKIMVELKALIKLDDLHMAQIVNYLEAYNLPIGLLINFGCKRLEYKRIYNSKHPENIV